MKTHESLSTAKALLGFFVLFVAFVVFYKFYINQDYLFEDPEMLRNYVVFAIVGGGFLVGLMYLGSQTKHPTSKSASKKKKR